MAFLCPLRRKSDRGVSENSETPKKIRLEPESGWRRTVAPLFPIRDTMPRMGNGATQISTNLKNPGAGWVLLAALVVLALVVAAAETALLVHRVSELGSGWAWLVGAAASLVVGAIAFLGWREAVGWVRVRRVERLRQAVDSNAPHTRSTRRLAVAWMRGLPDGDEADELRRCWTESIHAGDDDAARGGIRTFLDSVDERIDSEIRREAARTGVMVTLSGIALLDAVLCTWRNLRLMRCIATEYGARPGLIGTVRLLRMVLLHAIAVDLTQHAAEAVSTRIGTVAAAGGQGLIAATLTVRVGLWTQQVCRPIPRPRRSIAGFAVASAAEEVSLRVRRTVERAASMLRVRVGTGAMAN